jgi:hypothetical protein
MPFIRGRYYANPTIGNTIESAREAEGGLLASRDPSDEQRSGNDREDQKPVRRIEIDVAELVPSTSGRGTPGYVTTLHRRDPGDTQEPDTSPKQQLEKRVFYDPKQLASFLSDELVKTGSCR